MPWDRLHTTSCSSVSRGAGPIRVRYEPRRMASSSDRRVAERIRACVSRTTKRRSSTGARLAANATRSVGWRMRTSTVAAPVPRSVPLAPSSPVEVAGGREEATVVSVVILAEATRRTSPAPPALRLATVRRPATISLDSCTSRWCSSSSSNLTTMADGRALAASWTCSMPRMRIPPNSSMASLIPSYQSAASRISAAARRVAAVRSSICSMKAAGS
mmetsp:Transcript_11400/g.32281  ORF Transcript_11400/g.32281 Transcript_11400/m.32281 type:complete len:217 (-) Transcript_11400:1080-1730(-)